jgi:hypothetical protein
MTGISLVLATLLGQALDREPAELVRQLGSAKYTEREAAMVALEEMGPAALPALRAAGQSKDPEARLRAEEAIAKIELSAMKRASMIRLDVVDRPLDEVVERFGVLSPNRLAWHPETPEAVRRRPVTIREPAPLPFWTMIDRLCRVGGLRYIPGSPIGPSDTRRTEFRLYLTPGAWDFPRADSGPLRLEIVGIYHSRQINLIPNSEPPAAEGFGGPPPKRFGEREEGFYIKMRLLAEPRMLINQLGDALIAEAVDDRGHALFPGPAPYVPGLGYGSGPPARASADYSVSLKYPERAGPVIKRLKLTIPVGLETPKPDRLEIRLAGALGKTVRHGATSIEVVAVGPDQQGRQRVVLKLGSNMMIPEHLTHGPNGKLATVGSRQARPEANPNVFQVLDQQGRQFPWYVENIKIQGSEVTAELMMSPEGGNSIPVRVGNGIVPPTDRATAVPAVLYHTETARDIISGTFEFHDIPLP